ncbi:MAG: RRXRR domain-containing protein [Desulfobacca sp.]|nr:RRXRR domain-containing protein [Desulfobacca sp.]
MVQRTPFTIQLTIATGETVQPITLGVDSGYLHIGLSAVSEKEELIADDIELQNDIVRLNSSSQNKCHMFSISPCFRWRVPPALA